MIVYCVTILIDSSIVDDWRTWMQEVHIPEVLATNCFADHQFLEQMNAESPHQARFQIQYFCHSESELNQYRAEHAPALQASHSTRYLGHFQATRAVFRKID